MTDTKRAQHVPLAPAPPPWAFLAVIGGSLALVWLPALLGPPITGSPLAVRVLVTVILVAVTIAVLRLLGRLSLGLSADGLRVGHASASQLWPYHELQVAVTHKQLGLKTSGIDLSGYYSGSFNWNGPEARQVRAFATVPKRGVLVRRGGTVYFFTPQQPEAFAQALLKRGAQPLADLHTG